MRGAAPARRLAFVSGTKIAMTAGHGQDAPVDRPTAGINTYDSYTASAVGGAESANRLRFTCAVTARSLPPTWRYLLWRSS